MRLLNTDINTIIKSNDKSPPEKLNIEAVAPLIINTNKDFNIMMINASFGFVKNKQYITAILAKPSFTPGGNNGIGGIMPSTIDNTTAQAKNIDRNTMRLTRSFLDRHHPFQVTY